MIKVYGVHGSPFVRKVLIALDYKGVPYEIVPQMPFSGDKEFLNINPLGKIPTLVDGDLTLGDSKVICRYLEKAYPEPALYPADLADGAMADWYEELCGGAIAEMAAGTNACPPCSTTWKGSYPQRASCLVSSVWQT